MGKYQKIFREAGDNPLILRDIYYQLVREIGTNDIERKMLRKDYCTAINRLYDADSNRFYNLLLLEGNDIESVARRYCYLIKQTQSDREVSQLKRALLSLIEQLID